MEITLDDFIICIEGAHAEIHKLANSSNSKLEEYLFTEKPGIQPSEVIDELYPLYFHLNKLFYTPS